MAFYLEEAARTELAVLAVGGNAESVEIPLDDARAAGDRHGPDLRADVGLPDRRGSRELAGCRDGNRRNSEEGDMRLVTFRKGRGSAIG